MLLKFLYLDLRSRIIGQEIEKEKKKRSQLLTNQESGFLSGGKAGIFQYQ